MRRTPLWKLSSTLLAGSLLLAGCESMPTAALSSLADNAGALTSVIAATTGTDKKKAAGLTAGVQDVLGGAAAAFKEYSAQEQKQLGEEFSAVLLGASPLLRNTPVQRYVNQVGVWVAMQAEKPLDRNGREVQFDWRFGVTDSDAINAYATPGGYVFVTAGLLRQLQSEAELAAVLGHEIAHVVRGHYLSALRKGGFTQMAGGVIKTRTNNQAITGALVNAVRNIYAKGLDQSDEFDADRYGMLYAARAGYQPSALPTVLQMYVATSSHHSSQLQMLLNTHPAPTDRLAKLQPLLDSHFTEAGNATNRARYLAVRQQLGR